jgi:hypothetical protein
MAVSPMELSLDILPSERFDIIDVNQRAAARSIQPPDTSNKACFPG